MFPLVSFKYFNFHIIIHTYCSSFRRNMYNWTRPHVLTYTRTHTHTKIHLRWLTEKKKVKRKLSMEWNEKKTKTVWWKQTDLFFLFTRMWGTRSPNWVNIITGSCHTTLISGMTATATATTPSPTLNNSSNKSNNNKSGDSDNNMYIIDRWHRIVQQIGNRTKLVAFGRDIFIFASFLLRSTLLIITFVKTATWSNSNSTYLIIFHLRSFISFHCAIR